MFSSGISRLTVTFPGSAGRFVTNPFEIIAINSTPWNKGNTKTMVILRIYRPHESNVTIENPSPEQLIRAIHALDGAKTTNIQIYMPTGHLFISGPVQDRMLVIFSDGLLQAGVLKDRQQSNETWISFTWEGEQADDRPMCETVTKEVAQTVALYFLENNVLPKGHDWEGHIDTD